jgi:hypothetical protein
MGRRFTRQFDGKEARKIQKKTKQEFGFDDFATNYAAEPRNARPSEKTVGMIQ